MPALSANNQAGDSSSGSTHVTIPVSTAAGAYNVLACADDGNVVKGTIESNNCVASATTVNVTR